MMPMVIAPAKDFLEKKTRAYQFFFQERRRVGVSWGAWVYAQCALGVLEITKITRGALEAPSSASP